MQYFLIKQDERITDMPHPKDFFQQIDVRHVAARTAEKVSERVLVQLRTNEHMVFPDILCFPVMLFTQEVKNVVKAFDEYIPYRQVVYLDAKHEAVQLYFMPLLYQLTCLSENSEYINESKGAFAKVVLKRAPFRDKCLFQVKNSAQRLTVIRLDLVENILARGFGGFALTEVEIEH